MDRPETTIEFQLDKPTAGGIPAVAAALVISALIYAIVLRGDPATPIRLGIFTVVSFPALMMAWAGLQRRKLVIDYSRHEVWKESSLLGLRFQTRPIREGFDQVILDGCPDDLDTSALLKQVGGWERRWAEKRWDEKGFSVSLEGPEGRIELETYGDLKAAERLALAIAAATGLPASRRGYYLGKPREGAINRVQSEAVWQLAVESGVVITGDPADSGPLGLAPPNLSTLTPDP